MFSGFLRCCPVHGLCLRRKQVSVVQTLCWTILRIAHIIVSSLLISMTTMLWTCLVKSITAAFSIVLGSHPVIICSAKVIMICGSCIPYIRLKKLSTEVAIKRVILIINAHRIIKSWMSICLLSALWASFVIIFSPVKLLTGRCIPLITESWQALVYLIALHINSAFKILAIAIVTVAWTMIWSAARSLNIIIQTIASYSLILTEIVLSVHVMRK